MTLPPTSWCEVSSSTPGPQTVARRSRPESGIRETTMARDPKYDILLEPVRVGPKASRNRFWQTSHCTGYGAERPGTQARFRGMKAEGGWGVVCTEFCSIHPESDEYPWH